MKFEFTEQEINYIFTVLADRPFKEVEGLVNNIRKQYEDLTTPIPETGPSAI